ncbi:MAG: hypothetical protein ACREJC_18695 [Tepidisphaeraceae bacterium]
MNGSNSGSATAGPRSGMGTILSGIGSTVSDDPTLPGNSGIAKRIDILCLQECNASGTTGAQYAALLNQTYGTNVYTYGALAGATTGAGTQGVVFDSSKVQLISETVVGISSTTGQPRQTLRYRFRPVGYSDASDFYIYNAHFKAGSDSTSENRRLIEGNAIRADSNALSAGARIIYAGDFNVYRNTDQGYQALLASGSGQAFDPINQQGNWSDSSTFRAIHTQSPWDSVSGQSGFTGGGMDDRFDQQLVSANVNDHHGLAYIPDSYHAFGNNGSHEINKSINTGSGATPAVLAAESSILDHLPIVADYQLPARMGVTVSGVAPRVIIGAAATVNVAVANNAPVAFSNGADVLDYSVSGTGNLSGGAAVTGLAALTDENDHALALSTTTPGTSSGLVNVTSSSEGVGAFSQAVSTTVLAHAGPSLRPDVSQPTLTIDFGIRGRGLGIATSSFAVSNLPAGAGAALTAGLDMDSIVASGAPDSLWADLATFANLSPGGSHAFTASLSDASNGSFATSYTLGVSDENIPGAGALSSLSIKLVGIVATPGDTDVDGVITLDDYANIDGGFLLGLGGWGNGDFDGDGDIDLDDYALIDGSFLQQLGGRDSVISVLNYLAGESESMPTTLGGDKWREHFEQFGNEYATAFVAAVPEPVAMLVLSAAWLWALQRRRAG